MVFEAKLIIFEAAHNRRRIVFDASSIMRMEELFEDQVPVYLHLHSWLHDLYLHLSKLALH